MEKKELVPENEILENIEHMCITLISAFSADKDLAQKMAIYQEHKVFLGLIGCEVKPLSDDDFQEILVYLGSVWTNLQKPPTIVDENLGNEAPLSFSEGVHRRINFVIEAAIKQGESMGEIKQAIKDSYGEVIAELVENKMGSVVDRDLNVNVNVIDPNINYNNRSFDGLIIGKLYNDRRQSIVIEDNSLDNRLEKLKTLFSSIEGVGRGHAPMTNSIINLVEDCFPENRKKNGKIDKKTLKSINDTLNQARESLVQNFNSKQKKKENAVHLKVLIALTKNLEFLKITSMDRERFIKNIEEFLKEQFLFTDVGTVIKPFEDYIKSLDKSAEEDKKKLSEYLSLLKGLDYKKQSRESQRMEAVKSKRPNNLKSWRTLIDPVLKTKTALAEHRKGLIPLGYKKIGLKREEDLVQQLRSAGHTQEAQFIQTIVELRKSIEVFGPLEYLEKSKTMPEEIPQIPLEIKEAIKAMDPNEKRKTKLLLIPSDNRNFSMKGIKNMTGKGVLTDDIVTNESLEGSMDNAYWCLLGEDNTNTLVNKITEASCTDWELLLALLGFKLRLVKFPHGQGYESDGKIYFIEND